MAGLTPSFITGANAKIKFDAITVAYASSVSYTISVATVPVETIGVFEVRAHEPVAYMVEGTLSIVRYTSFAGGATAGASPNQTSVAAGNGLSQMNQANGGNAFSHFDPTTLIGSKTFDLEIFQKQTQAVETTAATATEAAVYSHDVNSVVKLKDCRFTRRGGGLDKRGVLVEQFAFNAILADEDSGTAGYTTSEPDLS